MARRAKSRRSKSVVGTEDRALPLFASAMRRQDAAQEIAQTEGRPDYISTGLAKVDAALGGGMPLGEITLVAARPHAGGASFLLGAGLASLLHGEPVAYFTERHSEERVRGRFVVLESRVNGFRFRAGFVSAEDRMALAAARERIPWDNLSLVSRRRIMPAEIDAHIFSYRPWLVVADIVVRTTGNSASRTESMLEGMERLASIARRHKVSILARVLLNKGAHAPDLLELPSLGRVADSCASVVLLHRQASANPDEDERTPPPGSSNADLRVVRVGHREISPRLVPLRFDQRFAGLLEA